MGKLVSIIIPVYNAEKNIERCLASVLEQSYSELEIIAVNDGSVDNSLAILERFAHKDKRVKIIDKQNGGVSSARNAGIKASNGQYMMFVDSDDYILNNAVEICVNNIADCDGVQFLCNLVSSDNKITSYPCLYNSLNICEINSVENIKHHLNGDLPTACWQYMYKTEIIKNMNITFPLDLNFGEDFVFILEFLLNSKKIKFLPELLYQYYDSQDSLTRGINNIINNVKKLPLLRSKILKLINFNDQFVYLYNMQNSKFLITNYAFFAHIFSLKEFKKMIEELNVTNVKIFNEFDTKKMGKGAKIFKYLNVKNHLTMLYIYMKIIGNK